MESVNGEINGERKFRKMFFNEISFCIAGIGLVSSIIFWVTNPQNDLQLQIVRLESQIESNSTVTKELQAMKMNDLNEINIKLLQLETRQIEELKAIARLEALLEEIKNPRF
jgi:hypothetical protein